tara:strand:+ start:2236 stop:2403 length:168 start_codon:yes stop_codon:yes gene_type:complete
MLSLLFLHEPFFSEKDHYEFKKSSDVVSIRPIQLLSTSKTLMNFSNSQADISRFS